MGHDNPLGGSRRSVPAVVSPDLERTRRHAAGDLLPPEVLALAPPALLPRPVRRVAIYARFSSQSSLEASIERQVASCGRYARRYPGCVIEVYADRAATGTTLERAELQRLLRDVDRGAVDVIIIETFDRLARTEYVAYVIRDLANMRRVPIFDVRIGELDPLSFGIAALMGADFRRAFLRAAIAGKIAAAREGRFQGVPYGYVPVEGHRGSREIHGGRADIVREIFARIGAGESPADLARDLTSRTPTPAQCRSSDLGNAAGFMAPWTAYQVGEIATNPIYKGVLQLKIMVPVRRGKAWRKELRHVVKHVPDKALVPGELWDRVYLRLVVDGSARPRVGRMYSAGSFTSRKVVCAHCHSRLRHSRGKLRCASASQGTTGCRGVGAVPRRELEEAVSGVLREGLLRGMRNSFAQLLDAAREAEIEARLIATASLEAEISRTEASLAAQLDDVLAGRAVAALEGEGLKEALADLRRTLGDLTALPSVAPRSGSGELEEALDAFWQHGPEGMGPDLLAAVRSQFDMVVVRRGVDEGKVVATVMPPRGGEGDRPVDVVIEVGRPRAPRPVGRSA
ncbi:MAG: recombinase family protein [Xanthobacteraceae bacterium]|nr:recombinase family protein [Xanthobacteraceae bacterium]